MFSLAKRIRLCLCMSESLRLPKRPHNINSRLPVAVMVYSRGQTTSLRRKVNVHVAALRIFKEP